MSSIYDQHHTHALPHPQVHMHEVGNRLVFKRYETSRNGDWAKGPYYTLRDVAGMLGYSYETVRKLVHDGKLKGYQRAFSCAIRIAREHLDEFLEQNQCHARANQPDLSEFGTKKTGMSGMDDKSLAQALRMKGRLNAS
ncbi:helix-turn-helix domain-containing protein [Magnetovibrio sp.]|uniref:helix-turn-helix domain-containing protein n=1 Tax=Magnetovibrio sp. TaxID=2024836 RepID=UPI002F92E70B